MNQNGEFFPVQDGYGRYIEAWYRQLVATTPAMEEFIARGAAHGVKFVPSRMVDAVEDMIAAYRKDENPGPPGKRSKLPVVFIAMGKDYMPVMGDWGRQFGTRTMVALTNEPDASVYGYRQAMFDVRTQIAIVSSEIASARSLAAQLGLWIAAAANRRFKSHFVWGEYAFDMPVMIENPDIQFMEVKTDEQKLTVLAADITLKATIPYLDAPKAGEPNDGSTHNPPGYPVVTEVVVVDHTVPANGAVVTEAGVERFDPSEGIP